MKYHIHFGEDYTLSFEIIDNPVAQAWAKIMQETANVGQLDQIIRRSVFPSKFYHVRYYNDIKYYYSVLKDEYNLDLEFELPSKEIEQFTKSDYDLLGDNIEKIYNKVVKNNYYYRTADKKTITTWSSFLSIMKELKEKLLDCYYDKENTARISNKTTLGSKVRITDEMRKEYWVETKRPNVILRLDSEFVEKTLDYATKRDSVDLVKQGMLAPVDYISSHYKICYYKESINEYEANRFMRIRRDTMTKFVKDNKLAATLGEYRNYYFVNPILGHCINKDITENDICKMFTEYTNITAEFGE